MLNYQVYSDQEAQEERYNLLKEGYYDAVIASSVDKTSSSGNPMMDITLQVFDENGRARNVRDFLVFTKSMMWKVIDFADSAGIKEAYNEGRLCSDLAIGNRVRVKVTVEPGSEISFDKLQGKPSGTRYPDKNKVEAYIRKGVQERSLPPTDDDPFADHDVPNFI